MTRKRNIRRAFDNWSVGDLVDKIGLIPRVNWPIFSVWFMHRFRQLGVDCLTLGGFLLFPTLILWTASILNIHQSTGAVIYILLFLISGVVIAIGKLALTALDLLKYSVREFSPPYSSPSIPLTDPVLGERADYLEFDTVMDKSTFISLLHLLFLFVWFLSLQAWLTTVRTPAEEIESYLDMVPQWVTEAIINTVVGITGISFNTIVRQISDPVNFVLFLILFGPFALFVGLCTWNALYALRLTIDDAFPSVE